MFPQLSALSSPNGVLRQGGVAIQARVGTFVNRMGEKGLEWQLSAASSYFDCGHTLSDAIHWNGVMTVFFCRHQLHLCVF